MVLRFLRHHCIWNCGILVQAGHEVCIVTTSVAQVLIPCSIQTWALEEARRRLEAEGILEDPEKKA